MSEKSRAPQFIIYGLFDPRTNGQLRYVGKSSNGLKRARTHGYPASLKRHAHLYVNRWIQQVRASGYDYESGVLEVSTPETLSEDEIWNIAYYKSLGCRLTNLTAGGEGLLGRKHSAATKAKMRASAGGLSPEASQELVSRYVAGESLGVVAKAFAIGRSSAFYVVRAAGVKLRNRMDVISRPRSFEARMNQSRAKGGTAVIDSLGRKYPSAQEAANTLGLHASAIVAVLNGRLRMTGGLVFTRYVESAHV